MRKFNKILMATVSVLLSLVLISTCLVSGIFARYTTKKERAFKMNFAEWNLTISSKGTDLKKEYTSDGNVIVKSSSSINDGNDNIIIPGSSGYLAWLRVTGTSEVDYTLDFSGTFSIGDGYSGFFDEIGRSIEYFPIGISLYRYDYVDGALKKSTRLRSHCIVRLTPDAPVGMTLVKNEDDKTTWDADYRMSLFNTSRWSTIKTLETQLNSGDHCINTKFDQTKTAGAIDSIYAIEWEWAYDPIEGTALTNSDTHKDNNRKTRTDGTVYTYQTKELDTQLGERIRANPESFKISLDFSVTITSNNPNP